MLGMPVKSPDPDNCGNTNPLINGKFIGLVMKRAGLTPSGNRIGQNGAYSQHGTTRALWACIFFACWITLGIK